MNKTNDHLSIEVWDLRDMSARLRPIIDRAARDDVSLYINCHAAPREDMMRVSELYELLSSSEVPYELNVSFDSEALFGAADYAG